jgi:hypothetical protein
MLLAELDYGWIYYELTLDSNTTYDEKLDSNRGRNSTHAYEIGIIKID